MPKRQAVEAHPITEHRTCKKVKTDTVTVWVDGAAKSNGKAHARAGCGVYFGPDDIRNVSIRVPQRHTQTNQAAELLAMTLALEILVEAKEKRNIILYTDSMYAINGMTSWIKNWRRNGWKTGKNKAVLHQDLWERMDKARSSLHLTLQHVRGHTGDVGNEAADRLAVAGSLMEYD